MHMYLLPYINNNSLIHDGVCIKALNYCKKRCTSQKCKKYYGALCEKKIEGFSTCPEGLTSYSVKCGQSFVIFSGIRCKNHFNRNKKIEDEVFCPVICENQVIEMVEASISDIQRKNQFLIEKEQHETNLHEIRKLNSQIKNHSESLFSRFVDTTDEYTISSDDLKTINDKLKTIWVSSCMIESRYSMIDYENNRSFFLSQSKNNTSIYKKFEKCSKILRGYNSSHVRIVLDNNFYKSIKAYSSFELIPLLILDNAVKYSDGSDVRVSFIEGPAGLSFVEIKSKGPYCSPLEIKRIFEKGFRGDNAKAKADGSGIGLYFVKKLCDLHDIGIEVFSDSATSLVGNTPYSDFTIKLSFHEVF